ncbi:AraC family transcriptional regulator [Mesorhizobium sp. M2A.F.Ca.ET.043.05.1.1]|uniref:helix-turn-helix domain-containing protein n=1 Tax=Mesorhizobium sp. M2A.F.Ca.ET.043.05.1.1 TaxID=2493671 RepID=UPI000F754F11|nr:AraC family transcriptional regulator [Mesorhizobium sp. M2A.F.Ca.ET.043.05.1.1]AZO16446.1 AraC family transcriptional regulator [Mesorhizobium sp. M2A.F.Ca.ET.043.05.1.1]
MSSASPEKLADGQPSAAPTVPSLTVGDVEIARTFDDAGNLDRMEPVSSGEAFNVTVQLRDLERQKVWRDGKLLFDGGRRSGDLMINDLRYQWQCQYLSPFDKVRFRVPFSSLHSFAEDAGRPEYRTLSCPPGTNDDVMLGLARALIPSLEHPQEAHPLFLEQINLAMLAHLIQSYGGVYFPSRKKGVLAPWQEKRSTEFLVGHVNASFSIAELAAACELSRSYFIKAFKQSFGRTPHRWLTEYRIARAKDLLRLDMPIAEIAIVCGFADQSHLTRVFSDHVGVSPGRFRRTFADLDPGEKK